MTIRVFLEHNLSIQRQLASVLTSKIRENCFEIWMLKSLLESCTSGGTDSYRQ